MNELYIIGGALILFGLLSLRPRKTDSCHCDQAEQGKNCKPECIKPPHLPRSQP